MIAAIQTRKMHRLFNPMKRRRPIRHIGCNRGLGAVGFSARSNAESFPQRFQNPDRRETSDLEQDRFRLDHLAVPIRAILL
jgi:hypothetical protein